MIQMFVKKQQKQNIVNQQLKQILHSVFKYINIIYTIFNFLRDGGATEQDVGRCGLALGMEAEMIFGENVCRSQSEVPLNASRLAE